MTNGIQSGSGQVFGQTLPALFGAVMILFAGYVLAKVLERLTERWLRRVRPNPPADHGGGAHAAGQAGAKVSSTRTPAKLVFWLVMLAVILVAANALGFDLAGSNSHPPSP